MSWQLASALSGGERHGWQVVRALEARLGDLECLDIIGYWPVGLEALAMLQGCRQTRYPIEALFKETMLKVMRDPLNHASKWGWANCYCRDDLAESVEEGQRLQTAAAYKVSDAGFDPMTFGRLSQVWAPNPRAQV